MKFRETKPGDDGLSGMVAIFDLSAYSHVPPLAEPLSREEEVMLRCRSWLLATLANEDDLVITWTPGPAARSADNPEVGGGLVISTREGLLLTGLPGTADACGVAVSSAGLGWYLPHAAGWFEVPLPGRLRAAVNVAFTLSEKVAPPCLSPRDLDELHDRVAAPGRGRGCRHHRPDRAGGLPLDRP